MNLVGATTWQLALTDLIVDSFHLARLLAPLALSDKAITLDLGAGAGLPGIPLRMVWQQGTYTMVEVRQKRQTFLAHALGQLELPRTQLFAGTAENALARQGPVEMVVSRAFKPWQEVLSLVRGQTRRVVFMTNAPAPQDLPEGWRLEGETVYESLPLPVPLSEPAGGASSSEAAGVSAMSRSKSSGKESSPSSRWLWIISS